MIDQGVTDSFLYELPLGTHNFLTDTFKLALYTSFADLGPNTAAYITANEVANGSGYTTGGVVLTGATVNIDAIRHVSYISFDDASWAAASFTARGGLIYNQTESNKTVAVLDFGADKNAGGLTFKVTIPAATSTTALIRLVRG